jgi:hypothetical protein
MSTHRSAASRTLTTIVQGCVQCMVSLQKRFFFDRGQQDHLMLWKYYLLFTLHEPSKVSANPLEYQLNFIPAMAS